MPSLSNVLNSGVFTFASGTGNVDFNIANYFIRTQDLNGDGVDELIFYGLEFRPNTSDKYSNTQISIFGWKNGQFQNITDQWLPGGLNKVEAVGAVSFGDFDGNGKLDIFLSANADREYQLNSYELLNQGDFFIKIALNKTGSVAIVESGRKELRR